VAEDLNICNDCGYEGPEGPGKDACPECGGEMVLAEDYEQEEENEDEFEDEANEEGEEEEEVGGDEDYDEEDEDEGEL
jgi:hypothetical protein